MEGNAVYCPLGKVRPGSGKVLASCVSRVSSATDCTLNVLSGTRTGWQLTQAVIAVLSALRKKVELGCHPFAFW